MVAREANRRGQRNAIADVTPNCSSSSQHKKCAGNEDKSVVSFDEISTPTSLQGMHAELDPKRSRLTQMSTILPNLANMPSRSYLFEVGFMLPTKIFAVMCHVPGRGGQTEQWDGLVDMFIEDALTNVGFFQGTFHHLCQCSKLDLKKAGDPGLKVY